MSYIKADNPLEQKRGLNQDYRSPKADATVLKWMRLHDDPERITEPKR